MHSPNRHTDELIAQVRRLLGIVEWLDQTASDHGHADDCCSGPLDALSSAKLDLPRLLHGFTHYSDGRPMLSRLSLDDGGMWVSHQWPADPAEHPTEPVVTEPYALAPDRTHGDRGHVVVTWCPVTFTGTAEYIAPPDPRRGLRAVR